ncbi:MAG: hypothetical protein ACE5IO_06165 [Thermoplasmata archaeon]
MNRRVVTIGLSALALLAPIFYYVSQVSVNILAVLWAYIDFGYGIHLSIVEPPLLTFTMPFLAFRIPYVYQVDKYYRHATSRRRALILGVVADGPGLFMPLLMLATILFSLPIGLYLFMPTPILY